MTTKPKILTRSVLLVLVVGALVLLTTTAVLRADGPCTPKGTPAAKPTEP